MPRKPKRAGEMTDAEILRRVLPKKVIEEVRQELRSREQDESQSLDKDEAKD